MSPDLLPSIPEVRRVAQALAMLDAILSPEWEYRYYRFNSGWEPGVEKASMENGWGDYWFLLLGPACAVLKGFAYHLADGGTLARDIWREVPAEFASFWRNPAFSMRRATFCYWRRIGDSSWRKVGSTLAADGADDLLGALVSGPSGYREWAEDYYEVPVSLEPVAALFSHQPLNDSLIRALNPEAVLKSIYEDAREIGYPRGAA